MLFFRPVLELTVLLPGMLLAYLPVKTYLKLTPLKLTCWMLPLLTGICISGGLLCYFLQISTKFVLPFMLLVALLLYHNTLRISLWKSGSIFFESHSIFSPSPVHSGQAPKGLLNEKSLGCSSGIEIPQSGQAFF